MNILAASITESRRVFEIVAKKKQTLLAIMATLKPRFENL
jgi:hypothetical protein